MWCVFVTSFILIRIVLSQDVGRECECVATALCKPPLYEKETTECSSDEEICCIRVNSSINSRTCGVFQLKEGFPWHVAITRKSDDTLLGSGALIHASVVVTTAHILDDLKEIDIRLRINSKFLGKNFDKNAIKSGVQKILRHEKYNRRLLSNDIALIYLKRNVELNENVSVICLPEQTGRIINYSKCLVSDWKIKISDDTLLKGNMFDIISRSQCQDHLGKSSELPPWFQLHSSVLCALPKNPEKLICRPDDAGSGGAPLFCDVTRRGNPEGVFTLTGLASWSTECSSVHPVMFTNIAKYGLWIDEFLKQIHGNIADFAF